MAEADGERSLVKGARRADGAAAAKGRAPLGPPKFIKRRLVAATLPMEPKRASRASADCGVRFLRVARLTPLAHRHAILATAPIVRLDYYVEALFQKLRPLALGLRGRSQPRVINVTRVKGAWRGVALACFQLDGSELGDWMAKNPVIRSLATVSLEESLAYLDAANGDELTAAHNLARDRNRLDGSSGAPDETEIHHALFLLRRARGLDAPSFDLMRVQLRRRVAA